MATFKIDDQTSFELENGEEVIFSNMPFMWRRSDLKGIQGFIPIYNILAAPKWKMNIAVTNKRVVTVPLPPNEKGFPVESFYYSDITGFEKSYTAESAGWFLIKRKREKNIFIVGSKVTAGKILSVLGREVLSTAEQSMAQMAPFSFANYQAKVDTGSMSLASAQAAYDKEVIAASKVLAQANQQQDFSHLKHNQNRDFLLQLAFTCWKAAKK